MPLDPKTREGKGRFAEKPPVELEDDILDKTLAEAGARTVIYDIFHLIVFGFLNALKGLVVVKGGATTDGDRRENKT